MASMTDTTLSAHNGAVHPGQPSLLAEQPDPLYQRSNLSRLQLLYWVGQKLRADAPIFNTILTFTIQGPVDYSHFQRAFQALLDHSDALRTVIEESDGIPQRRVMAPFTYTLPYIDLAQEPAAVYENWVATQCKIALPIEQRLFDTALIKIADNQFVWYFNQHHIIADAASFFLCYAQLAHFYHCAQHGAALTQSGLPTFASYIDAERAAQTSPQAARARAYWQGKQAQAPAPLWGDGQPSVQQTTEVQRQTVDLGVARTQRLRTLANQKSIYTVSEELSLYNIFITLFFMQLYHRSGQQQLGVITPVHNRFTAKAKETIGLVMALCPFQVEVTAEETFHSLLAKVKRETRAVMANSQGGAALDLHNEGFPVMFNMHAMPAFTLGEWPVQVARIHPGAGSEQLALHVNDTAATGTFLLHFDFNTSLFTPAQQAQLIDAFVQQIDTFWETADQPLGAPRLLAMTGAADTVPPPQAAHRAKTEQAAAAEPQDVLEFKLVQLWEELLNIRPIGIHDDFFALGGNSWLAVRLFAQLEQLTGQYLPLTTLLQMPTIATLAAGLRQEMGTALWSTLITIQPGHDRMPLFCVPGAGGNGLAIARIAQAIGVDQPVYMFQIPLGNNGEETPFTTIEAMATHYTSALRAVQPHGPYLLAGYSAGGVVAFEVAQQLQRQNETVALLAIIDVPAQGALYRYVRHLTQGLRVILKLEADRELTLYLAVRDALFRLTYFVQRGYREWLQRTTRQVRGYLARCRALWQAERTQQRAGMNASHGENIMAQAQPKAAAAGDLVWQAEDPYMRNYFAINSQAVKQYVPKPYPGRITLFRSSEGYRYAEMRSADPLLGWGKIAKGKVEMYVVPGDHMQIVREPSVKQLGEQLKRCLERVQTQAS